MDPRVVLSLLLALLLSCALACSENVEPKSSTGGGDTTADSDRDASENTDASADADASDHADADADASADTDGNIDPNNDFDPEIWACSGEYQLECNDDCINFKTDPDSCGSCGNACEADQACVGGECRSTCLDTEVICGRRCIDTDTDSQNCGACENICADGLGCVAGSCVPTLSFDEPDWCENGGPPLRFDLDDDDRCVGSVAEDTFRWAMCVCNEAMFTGGGGLSTDAFDSNLGPYLPGVLGGGVGLNRNLGINGTMDIGGSLWVGGSHDTNFGGGSVKNVAIDLHVGRDVNANSGLTIDGHAFVGGNFTGTSPLTVGETLTIPDSSTVSGAVVYNELIREPVSVDSPCTCDDDALVPILGLVTDRATNNDNDRIGLASDALMSNAYSRLELPCGNYYLSGINNAGALVIEATGRTALFIDGDISAGQLTIIADPDAELDVFVSGSLTTNGLFFGSPHYPANTRLYIGGPDGIHITSDVRIGGFLYVYPGNIHITQSVDIYGGLFSNNVHITKPVSIHYDRNIQRSGRVCELIPDPEDPGDADGDATGDGDETGDGDGTGDGDDDPICISLDGICSVDGDCCAPLVCDQGFCATARCSDPDDACVYNSDCCVGFCGRTAGESEGVCIVN